MPFQVRSPFEFLVAVFVGAFINSLIFMLFADMAIDVGFLMKFLLTLFALVLRIDGGGKGENTCLIGSLLLLLNAIFHILCFIKKNKKLKIKQFLISYYLLR